VTTLLALTGAHCLGVGCDHDELRPEPTELRAASPTPRGRRARGGRHERRIALPREGRTRGA